MKSSSAQVSDRLCGRFKATADLSLRHEDHARGSCETSAFRRTLFRQKAGM
jgi:hypothetical protein